MQRLKHEATADRVPAPLYQRVRESLRERILDGTYNVHEQLPAESELIGQFGVSRITVRQALNDLRNEGLIFKIHGKGSFVAKPKASQKLTKLEGFGEAMARAGHEIYNLVTSFSLVEAAPDVALALGLAPATVVSEIKRIRHLNREPISLEITYLPATIGERLRGADLAKRDIFSILENDFAIPLGRADLKIGATLADSGLAQALNVAQGSALLQIERLTSNASGQPLDFEYLYLRGDAFQYQLQIERNPGAASR